MTERAVIPFDDPECRQTHVAGGKGASLAKMAAEGLPVPAGFVVPSWVLEQSVDADRLRALAQNQAHDDAHRVVMAAEPPRHAITESYSGLAGRVAVRSSACAEDSEAASYAGQQESYLGVEGVDEVCKRVVDCWASFFTERALFYRARMGSLDDLRMAVVVQTMLDPEKSGVLFTVDPVHRRRDRMVIEAVYGLGEQVVSGAVTPDHYVVDRSGVVKRQVLAHGGVLTEDELRRLVELGKRLERQFDGPQDVEWAIVKDEVFLLQSRPVTAL